MVVHGVEHLPKVSERLLGLPEEMHLALAFRTYAVATLAGMATPGTTRRLGSRDFKPCFWPVFWSDAVAFTEEAGIPHINSRAIEEAMRVGGLIGQASRAAAHFRLRDPRFSREPEHLAAKAAIETARGEIAKIGDADLRARLTAALSLVEGELDSPQGESLAEARQAVSQARQDLLGKVNEVFAASSTTATLQELLSRASSRA